ncbi:MAG: hypothetical protein R3F43_01925 [bacterium]
MTAALDLATGTLDGAAVAWPAETPQGADVVVFARVLKGEGVAGFEGLVDALFRRGVQAIVLARGEVSPAEISRLTQRLQAGDAARAAVAGAPEAWWLYEARPTPP